VAIGEPIFKADRDSKKLALPRWQLQRCPFKIGSIIASNGPPVKAFGRRKSVEMSARIDSGNA
jgi:hypothetical protein